MRPALRREVERLVQTDVSTHQLLCSYHLASDLSSGGWFRVDLRGPCSLQGKHRVLCHCQLWGVVLCTVEYLAAYLVSTHRCQ